ncbi:uncharacterized protein C19orf47 homolog isoform X2 [Mya arenaria]|uniref:uncharacterized protein C19orf47 homolog isoform X2 n=1 Tax=Mya arenaria TaxID=6604 RepID=UPI0022E72705|nr:uncharacterized protein C19orf47 homolog isoform X2 [Mya arenaria]
MASSDMSFWIGFFKEAGIPAGEAANYAVTFTDNRITRSMLMDLTKEYLNDMGLSILGDVIAVLKHAKTVFNQDVRDRVLRDTSAQQETPTLKRSTPASRTIGHYLSGSDRSASPQLVSSIPKLSKEMSARLGSPITTAAPAASPSIMVPRVKKMTVQAPTAQPLKEEVPVQKKKKVFPEDEGHYTINLPQGSTDRTKKILAQHRQQAELQRIRAEEEKKRVAAKKHSVFHRLGSEKKTTSPDISDSSPTVTITGLDSINMPSTSMGNQTIFSRLGGKTTVKRAATSTVSLDDDDSDDRDDDAVVAGPILEYAGVLKASPSKKAKIVTAKKIMKSAQKTLARAKSVEHKTEGMLAQDQPGGSSIKARLGKIGTEVSSTTQAQTRQPDISVAPTKKAMSSLSSSQLEKITITVATTPRVKVSSSTVQQGITGSKVKASPLTGKGLQEGNKTRSVPVTSTSSNSKPSGVFSRLGKPKS